MALQGNPGRGVIFPTPAVTVFVAGKERLLWKLRTGAAGLLARSSFCCGGAGTGSQVRKGQRRLELAVGIGSTSKSPSTGVVLSLPLLGWFQQRCACATYTKAGPRSRYPSADRSRPQGRLRDGLCWETPSSAQESSSSMSWMGSTEVCRAHLYLGGLNRPAAPTQAALLLLQLYPWHGN